MNTDADLDGVGEAIGALLAPVRAAFGELIEAVPKPSATTAGALKAFDSAAEEIVRQARGLEFERSIQEKKIARAAQRAQADADQRKQKIDAARALRAAAAAKGKKS